MPGKVDLAGSRGSQSPFRTCTPVTSTCWTQVCQVAQHSAEGPAGRPAFVVPHSSSCTGMPSPQEPCQSKGGILLDPQELLAQP